MEQITLVKGAINRPDEPSHFMQLKFPEKSLVAAVGALTIAKTDHPLVLSEVGYGIYDPVVYFPIKDVNLELLEPIAKSTFCPLKGDTEYFNMRNAKND